MGSVSVLLVRPLVAAIGSTAGPTGGAAGLEAFWGATDLTPQIVADDDARISAPQRCAAWDEALRLTGDRLLPLRIAAATQPGAFGIVEHVCRAAPTLGEALRQWVRYLNLLDDTATVGLEVEEDRAVLRVERESEPPAPAAHELCWALVARYARELCEAPVRPLAVELAHRRGPDDVAPYQAWFEAPVVSGAEATQLVLPRDALAARLVPSDPALLAILTRAADELASRSSADPLMTQQVKRVLHEALRSDDAQVESVAMQLGLTVRSLQRRLKDEGTSFQAVREDVRRTLAQRYLDDGLAITEISFLLGFSEPSAFFRAFKRWTGMTPVERRAQHRAAPAPAPA
jgi:AraC-like DNA-binding protein